jgi:hypothetical protein
LESVLEMAGTDSTTGEEATAEKTTGEAVTADAVEVA